MTPEVTLDPLPCCETLWNDTCRELNWVQSRPGLRTMKPLDFSELTSGTSLSVGIIRGRMRFRPVHNQIRKYRMSHDLKTISIWSKSKNQNIYKHDFEHAKRKHKCHIGGQLEFGSSPVRRMCMQWMLWSDQLIINDEVSNSKNGRIRISVL